MATSSRVLFISSLFLTLVVSPTRSQVTNVPGGMRECVGPTTGAFRGRVPTRGGWGTTFVDQREHPSLPSPVLKASDLSALNAKAQAWLGLVSEANMVDQVDLSGKKEKEIKSIRAKNRKKIRALRKKARKAKEKFLKDFAKRGKKVGTLLKYVADLRRIFDGVFPYKGMFSDGKPKKRYAVKKKKTKEVPFWIHIPKGYKVKKSWPLILDIPGKNGESWQKAEGVLNKAWTGGTLDTDFIIACPEVLEELDLDAEFDPLSVQEEMVRAEGERRKWMFSLMRDLLFNFRIETDRFYLSASDDSVPFILRFASAFPDRFAGLVIKNPKGIENATVPNLMNLSVLIIYDKDHKSISETFAKNLKEAGNENVTLLEGKGTSPFAGNALDIEKWAQKTFRLLYPRHVKLLPVSDRLKKAYWVKIDRSEGLGDVPAELRPRIEVKADPENNRIEIKSTSVWRVTLYLNDFLVDLDKEISIVVNGVVQKQRRQRSMEFLQNMIIRRGDPRNIYVTSIRLDIPKPASKDQGEEEEKKGEGDSH